MLDGLDKVGVLAAQLMDQMEEESEPEDNETIGEVMLLAEVRGTDANGPYTYITWRCSDKREWAQRGMLHAGLHQERRVHGEGSEEP